MKRSSARPPARLFAEPDSAGDNRPSYIAQIDGAARGNPGPASYAVILRGPDGSPLDSLGKYIGRTTNNVAEYYALIAALDAAAARGIRRLRIRSDSELLVRQMKGAYKVKSADLKPLHERAQKAARAFEFFSIEHVPRDRNREADALANQALDRISSAPPASGRDYRAVRVRALVEAGKLVPAQPLDFVEGEEVIVTIEPARRKPS
ncbi:MAG: reverse transcriptase-like protein [Candidatus Acidiferrales bacterium]